MFCFWVTSKASQLLHATKQPSNRVNKARETKSVAYSGSESLCGNTGRSDVCDRFKGSIEVDL